MELKDNIKRFRELKGLSVPALAKAIGAGKQSVYDWEAGKYEPSPDNIDQLVRVLEVKKKDLFDENPTSDWNANNNKEKMNAEEIYRNLVESNSEYRLIPKIILDQYEIIPKRELEERAEIVRVALAAKNDVIAELKKEISDLRAAKQVHVPAQQA